MAEGYGDWKDWLLCFGVAIWLSARLPNTPMVTMRPSQTTKFGYGFLFAGCGLPYLVDKLLGPTWAISVAVVCTVLGFGLLISAHCHKESAPPVRRTVAAGLVMLAVIVVSIWMIAARQPVTKTSYDHAHLAVVSVQLRAAPVHSEAMITVRNIGSKPVVPCAALRGAIITSPWLNGSESEDQLFRHRAEWQEGGKGQVNCDADWNPGVEKTYSIQLASAIQTGPDDWTSLMRGDKIWYVVSRLQFRDSDKGLALPEIENCVWFRSETPEWTINRCFGHNDPTLKGNAWLKGSGRAVDE